MRPAIRFEIPPLCTWNPPSRQANAIILSCLGSAPRSRSFRTMSRDLLPGERQLRYDDFQLRFPRDLSKGRLQRLLHTDQWRFAAELLMRKILLRLAQA